MNRRLRLSARRRWLAYGVGSGLWLSGGVWLLLHHGLMRQGALRPAPHPAEPWCLTLHGAFAVAAIWTLGLLWGVHISAGWSTGRRRWSGGLLAATLAWLTLSGYLLYYLGDERLRTITALLHWSIGLALPIGFAAHRLARRLPAI